MASAFYEFNLPYKRDCSVAETYKSKSFFINCCFDQVFFRASAVSIKCRFNQVSFRSSVVQSSVVLIKCRLIKCRSALCHIVYHNIL